MRMRASLPAAPLAHATLAAGVVFTGALDGIFRAYDAATGQQLWAYQTASGLNAPPAIVGDTVYLPAAGPLVKPSAGISPGATPPAAQPQVKAALVAFKLGS